MNHSHHNVHHVRSQPVDTEPGKELGHPEGLNDDTSRPNKLHALLLRIRRADDAQRSREPGKRAFARMTSDKDQVQEQQQFITSIMPTVFAFAALSLLFDGGQSQQKENIINSDILTLSLQMRKAVLYKPYGSAVSFGTTHYLQIV